MRVSFETEVEVTAAHVARPGDTLVLTVPMSTTTEMVHRIKAVAEERLRPLGIDVVILGGIDVAIVRPDWPPDTANGTR